MGWLTTRLGYGKWGTIDTDNPSNPPQVTVANAITISNPGGSTTFPIVTTLNPSLAIGTIAYFQTGMYGTPLGLLLSLTMTPKYIKMLMTDHGLRPIT